MGCHCPTKRLKIPEEHIMNIVELENMNNANPTKLNYYLLWRYIKSIFPEESFDEYPPWELEKRGNIGRGIKREVPTECE